MTSFNRTKIICTVGPTSETKQVLKKMVQAGMDAVRLNFSHGTYDQFSSIIKIVREISKEEGREIGIIQDLQGPKIRIGDLPKQGVPVKEGDKVVLSIVDAPGTIPVQYKFLPQDVKKNDLILIADGLIELKVLDVNKAKTQISCVTVVGGLIEAHKGINVPTASINAPALTKKDKEDVIFGAKAGVDYVALSFVRDVGDIHELRAMLRKLKSPADIIAKIERHEALNNLDEIVKASDAIMIARGDLGVEIPAEQVPIVQKKLIHVCNTYGKPVIVATHMLASMEKNPRATRAEISDAANAIFDHADAVMLSNETAVGLYPVEATKTLQKVATAVEEDLKKHKELLRLRRPEEMPITNATCLNATKLAQDINAAYIVALTRSGYTAREMAKYRPFIPIVVFSSDINVARKVSIVWGVEHCVVEWIDLKEPLTQVKKRLKEMKLIKRGDEIVICNAGFGRKEKLITTTTVE